MSRETVTATTKNRISVIVEPFMYSGYFSFQGEGTKAFQVKPARTVMIMPGNIKNVTVYRYVFVKVISLS